MRRRTQFHPRRGQTIIEAALVLPLFLLLLMVVVQYSILMNATASLRNLSREGARFASTQPASDQAIRERMQQVCPPSIKWSDVTADITPAEGAASRTSNNPIHVTLTYNMGRKLFLPSQFFGVKLFSSTYTYSTRMLIE